MFRKVKLIRIPGDAPDFIAQATEFVRNTLVEFRVDKKLRIQAMLLAEEVLVRMHEHLQEGELVTVRIIKKPGQPIIEIHSKGEEFDVGELAGELAGDDPFDAPDEETEDAIRSVIIHAYGDKLKYRYKNGVNLVSIAVGETGKKFLYYTVGALLLALLAGFGARMAFPDEINESLCNNIFSPIKTMFINALKIVVGPVVFFSIVTCISQFKDLSELGRIGAKVMTMYFFTTIVAVTIGFSAFFLVKPGKFGMALSGTEATEEVALSNVSTSPRDTLIDIVPSNFIKPFLESNTLQIIFLAVIAGIAVGMIGDYSKILTDFFEACNSLFLTITSIISRLIPLAIFSAVFLMVVETGTGSLVAMLGMTAKILVSSAASVAAPASCSRLSTRPAAARTILS